MVFNNKHAVFYWRRGRIKTRKEKETLRWKKGRKEKIGTDKERKIIKENKKNLIEKENMYLETSCEMYMTQ